MDALLKCERDHVGLVASKMRKAGSVARSPGAGALLDRLLIYIRDNQHRFVDLRRGAADDSRADANLGYTNEKDGQLEFLFTEGCFEQMAGGKAAAVELKRELDRRGLIDKTGAGRQGTKLVVRRQLPVGPENKSKRQSVVAIFQSILDINGSES